MTSSQMRKYISGFFLNATKSNKMNVFKVPCLQVYECFCDTQCIAFVPSHQKCGINVRRELQIHCHCFFLSFCWLFIMS